MKKFIFVILTAFLLSFVIQSQVAAYFNASDTVSFSHKTGDWVPPILTVSKKSGDNILPVTELINNGDFEQQLNDWRTTGNVKVKDDVQNQVELSVGSGEFASLTQKIPTHAEKALHFEFSIRTEEDVPFLLTQSFQVISDEKVIYEWFPPEESVATIAADWHEIALPLPKTEKESELTFALKPLFTETKPVAVQLRNISTKTALVNAADSVIFKSDSSNATVCLKKKDEETSECHPTPYSKMSTADESKHYTVTLTNEKGLVTENSLWIVADLQKPKLPFAIKAYRESPTRITVEAVTVTNQDDSMRLEVGVSETIDGQYRWHDLTQYDWLQATLKTRQNDLTPMIPTQMIKVIDGISPTESWVKLRLLDAAGNTSLESEATDI